MNRLYRVAIDSRTINSSSGRYVAKLIEYLNKLPFAGIEYLILVRKQDLDHPLFKARKLAGHFKVVQANFKDYSFQEQINFKFFLDKLSPDLVHFTFPQHPVLYRGRFVVTVHDLIIFGIKSRSPYYKFKQLVFKLVFKRAVKKSYQIIVPTKYVRRTLLDNFFAEADKVSQIYESADRLSASVKPVPGLAGRQYILTVNNGLPHKNNTGLIKAHQLLVQKHPDLCLVIAGRLNDHQKQLQAAAAEKGYRNVVFTGFVEDSQLVWLYRHAQAYIFPSLSEGFGLPGLEAMYFGVPVISSNNTCLPEVYGQASDYFNPRDHKEMAVVIHRVLTDPQRKQQLLKEAKKQLAKYSWRKMAQETQSIYLEILNEMEAGGGDAPEPAADNQQA